MIAVGRKAEPSLRDLEKRLRDTLDGIAACQAEIEQLEAAEAELLANAADFDTADWQRERAIIDRRLVERRRELEHLEAVEASVRQRGVSAVNAQSARGEAEGNGERERLVRERRRLLSEVARLDEQEAGLDARLARLWDQRLPLLARFDPAAAATLAEREHARRGEAAQLAYRIIGGEEVAVPADLEGTVAQVLPDVRAGLEQRDREQRANLRAIGYLRLDQHERSAEPVRRGGFADPDDED